MALAAMRKTLLSFVHQHDLFDMTPVMSPVLSSTLDPAGDPSDNGEVAPDKSLGGGDFPVINRCSRSARPLFGMTGRRERRCLSLPVALSHRTGARATFSKFAKANDFDSFPEEQSSLGPRVVLSICFIEGSAGRK